MRFVIQRVSHASVTVDETVIGEIGTGFLVLIGVSQTDTTQTADKMMRKLLNMRIFPDENGKTNLALKDVGGALLMVSQFTLYADCKKGNRPSFTAAGAPETADALYEYCVGIAREQGFETQTGQFGAHMRVQLCNEGPFTILLDSDRL